MSIDHSPVDLALSSYEAAVDAAIAIGTQQLADAQTQLAAAVASGSATQAKLDAANAQVASLKAQLAALQNQPALDVVTFSDFATASAGLVFPGSVNAPGRIYKMVPHTSTKASQVPTTYGTTTNPFTLLVAGGTAASPMLNLSLSGFSFYGTDQGMLFNGLRVGYANGAEVVDLFGKGIPGNSGANPGETFTFNFWHANSLVIKRLRADGTDDTGKRVAASAFGFNNSTGITSVDCSAHGTQYGSGATHYKCANITHTKFDASDCHRPFNFERCSGSIVLDRCVMTRSMANPHVTVNTDVGSAKVTIIDPVVDAWPLHVGVVVDTPTKKALYMGNPQTQKVSDVQLIVGGKDVTADPKYLFCGNSW